MRGKEESERAEVKLNTPIAKIMASGPIPSWQIDGGKVETVTDFIFLGYKITTDNDESHENKRCLLLGRKAMTNLDSLLESRDITLPTKVSRVRALVFPVVTCGVSIVRAPVFPVVTCGCESWTMKKAEHRRTDAFWKCGAEEDA